MFQLVCSAKSTKCTIPAQRPVHYVLVESTMQQCPVFLLCNQDILTVLPLNAGAEMDITRMMLEDACVGRIAVSNILLYQRLVLLLLNI